jgi:hypothetical protein
LDYIAAEEAEHEHIEDEDGEIARIRHEENLNDAWAQRHAHEDPVLKPSTHTGAGRPHSRTNIDQRKRLRSELSVIRRL